MSRIDKPVDHIEWSLFDPRLRDRMGPGHNCGYQDFKSCRGAQAP